MAVVFRKEDGTVVRFPAGTTPEEIEEALAESSPDNSWRQGAPAVKENARSLWGSIKRGVQGPEGLPDLGEFQPPLNQFGAGLKTAIGTAFASSPEARGDVVRNQYPDAVVTPAEAEGKRYNIVSMLGPDGQPRHGYVNPPGLDFSDVTRLGVQGAAFAPAVAPFRTAGLLARTLGTGGLSGLTSVGMDAVSGLLGSEQGINPWAAIGATVGGSVGELAQPLVAGAGRLIGGNRYITRSGQWTESGRRAAREMGLDADLMSPEGRAEFARLAGRGVDPDTAARSAAAAEFDIPTSAGRLSDDYTLLQREERLRRGLEGRASQSVVDDFDARRNAALAAAPDTVTERLTGRPSLGGQYETGEAILQGVRRRAAEARAGVDEAYDFARGFRGGVDASSTGNLMGRVRASLDDAGYSPELAPATKATLDRLQEMGTLDGAPASLPFQQIENVRRIINRRMQNATGDDKALLPKIKSAFDDWLDDVVDQGLIEGDPTFLDAFKKARELNYAYKRIFTQNGSLDTTGRILDRLANHAETPEQAVNYLFGQSSLGNARQAAGAVKNLRDILPPEDFSAIKELAWNRLSRDRQGNALSPKMFDKAWKDFRNRNRSLMNEIFSEPEISLIDRYGQALMASHADPTNPSQTAFAIENALRSTMRAFGSRARITGNPITGLGLTFASRLPLNPMELTSTLQRRQAQRIVGGIPTPRPTAMTPELSAALGREPIPGLLQDYLSGEPE